MNDDEIKVIEISGAWKFYIGKQDGMNGKPWRNPQPPCHRNWHTEKKEETKVQLNENI